MKIERVGLLALGASLASATRAQRQGVQRQGAQDRFDRRQVSDASLPPCDTITFQSTLTPPQQTVTCTQNVTSYVPELATVTEMPTYFTTVDLGINATTITSSTTETDATTRTLVQVDFVTDTVQTTETDTVEVTETDTITVPITETDTAKATVTDTDTVNVTTQPTTTVTQTIYTQGGAAS